MTDILEQPSKTVTDRAGNVYKSLADKMKYTMRRRRNSPLPHYPHRETRQEF